VDTEREQYDSEGNLMQINAICQEKQEEIEESEYLKSDGGGIINLMLLESKR